MSNQNQPGMFFIIGPLRTGSSLMTRCVDDHPQAICLCESQIDRALFRDYFVRLHCQRMLEHGLTLDEIVAFLDRKKQEEIEGLLTWYRGVCPRLSSLYDKPNVALLGDKSPDFAQCPEIVNCFASSAFPLIYTVRDPRAIFRSIAKQSDATDLDKAIRWESLIANYRAWKPHLDASHVLVVRFEDLVTAPQATMTAVYSHLGLPNSTRFLESFTRPFPRRFLWNTAIDMESGTKKDFDSHRIRDWSQNLNGDQLQQVYSDPLVVEFMERFGYER